MRQAVIAAWLCIPIAPAAADTVTLRYGQIPSTVRSVSALYLSIAQQKGFFAREEVKLDLIPIAGGTDKMIAALDHGTVDVTQTATPYLIRAVRSGSDAVAIAG
jgi:ABC-type nitrate/sulfonate/bicarbonate transport system substrate-binding protein